MYSASRNRGGRGNYGETGGRGSYSGRGGRRGYSRTGGRGSRSGRGRNGPPKSPFIRLSPDENDLEFYLLGPQTLGKQSLIDSFTNSLKKIGHYSENSEKEFVNDKSCLSFLLAKYLPDPNTKEKDVYLDLKGSESDVQEYTGTGEQSLNNVFQWIINNKNIYDEAMLSSKYHKDDGGIFVTVKNVLGHISKIPYNFGADLKLLATSIGGVIYLMKENIGYEKENENHEVRLWGHKFESFMTKEDTRERVFCNEDFRVMLSADIGPHRLLFSTSTDCADPYLFSDDFEDLSSFVALKCCVERPPNDPHIYRGMYFYLHCIFAGVPKVLVGYRNDDGIVSKLKMYTTAELLHEGKESWNPITCFFFTAELLTFIKKKVEANPGSVFCFKKEPRSAVIHCTEEYDSAPFIPDWFINEIQETSSST